MFVRDFGIYRKRDELKRIQIGAEHEQRLTKALLR